MLHTFAPLDALLFDMDGTLTDSRAASERCWVKWAERHRLDPQKILGMCHGRQARDTIRLAMPDVDVDAEAAWLLQQELADDGVEAIAGAVSFMRKLPTSAWALVTSAAEPLARYRLKLAGMPSPKILISAADVPRGKPDPAGFLLAARKMGADPARCLVFEDSDVGIEAGHKAGMQTLAIDASGAGRPRGAKHAISHYDRLQVVVGPPLQVTMS